MCGYSTGPVYSSKQTIVTVLGKLFPHRYNGKTSHELCWKFTQLHALVHVTQLPLEKHTQPPPGNNTSRVGHRLIISYALSYRGDLPLPKSYQDYDVVGEFNRSGQDNQACGQELPHLQRLL